jgi:DNA-binding SARP family transcriptional activator
MRRSFCIGMGWCPMQQVAVRLTLLGRFGIESLAPTPARIAVTSRKGRALLAYLALQPGYRASRAELATLLWGDHAEKQARQSLRQCLARLRHELEAAGADILRPENETVALGPAVAVDAVEFARLAGAGASGDLESALHKCGGEFLADLTVASEAFEAWAGRERQRLAAIAAQAHEALAVRCDAAGRSEPAIDHAERLVASDPLREDWQRLLIRLLARYRGREAALARARELAAQLRRELGVAPEPATAALIAEIRNGAPPSVAAADSSGRVAPEPVRRAPPPAWLFPHRLAWAAGAALLALMAAGALLGVQRPHLLPWSDGAAPASSAADLIARGRAADLRGDIAAALVHYEEALKHDPDSIPAMVGIAAQLSMGAATHRLERGPSLERAKRLLDRALARDPNHAAALYWLGSLLRMGGRDYQGSLQAFARALEVWPNYAGAHAGMGRTLALMGRLDEALAHLERALALDPTSPQRYFWLFAAGEARLELGQDEAALRALLRAAEIAPNYLSIKQALAATYALLGDSENAARYAAEVKEQALPNAFGGLLHYISQDASKRRAHQPRLIEGLRRAFASELAAVAPPSRPAPIATATPAAVVTAAPNMTWKRFAQAGQEVLINRHASLDDDCRQNGFPALTLLQQPAHGRIEVRRERLESGSLQRGRPGKTDCRGVDAVGIGVYYQPQPGFSGSDRLVYRLTFPTAVYFEDTIEITVSP